MKTIGRVETLWRYPVKSMRGELLQQAFAGFGGIYGDRWYAISSAGAIKGFPYLTARDKGAMLLYTPSYRHAARMLEPLNLAEAKALGPGITPVYAEGEDWAVDVRLPSGEVLAVDDPQLIESLQHGLDDRHELRLLRSRRALTDCRPISLFSRQTAEQLSAAVGVDLAIQRFRANLYLDLEGFSEDALVGKMVRIGAEVVIAVTDRDPRCKMITLDPDSGVANPEVMRVLAREHEGYAGVYGAVVVEGRICEGDAVAVLD